MLGREVVANIVEMMTALIPHVRKGKVLAEPGFLRVSADLATPLFNGVIGTDLSPRVAEQKAQETLTYFKELHLPMSWWVYPSSNPRDLGEILTANGYAYVFSSAGMAYRNLGRFEPKFNPSIEISPVASTEDFEALRVPLESFQLGSEAVDALFQAFPLIAPPNGRMQNYVGRVNGEPVSSGALYFGESSAGIYNIATIPSARGHGYGSAVTAYLMQIAREKKYDAVVLISSKMGHSVYEKLGFEDAISIDYYVPEP